MKRLLAALLLVTSISTPAAALTPAIGDAFAITGIETVLVSWVPLTGDLTNIKYVVTAKPGGQSCEVLDQSQCKLEGLIGGSTISISIVGTTTTGFQFSKSLDGVVVKAGPPAVDRIRAVPGNRKITVSFPTLQGNALPDSLGYVARTVPAAGECYIAHNSMNAMSSCVIGGLTNGYYYDVVVTTQSRDLKKDSKPVARVRPTFDPDARFSISVKPSGPVSKRAGTLTITAAGSILGKYCMRVTYLRPSAALLAQLQRDWEYNADYISGSGGSLPDGTMLDSIGSVSGGCVAPGKIVLKAAKAIPADMGWKKPTKPGKYSVFATLYYSNDEFRRFRAPDELVAVSPLVPVTVR